MQILGMADHVNCGSALVKDGKVIAAINDERLIREKMVFGVPRESIQCILEMAKISPNDIDAIAISTKNQHFIGEYLDFKNGWFGLERSRYKQVLFDIASQVSKHRSEIPFINSFYYALRQPAFIKRRIMLKKIMKTEFGFSCPIRFLDHHFCHLTSAYYTSGFKNSTVFSIDGGGDGLSARVHDVSDGVFNELVSIPSFDSLGNFYSYVTQFCGYKAGKHEGKITGLAAYGDPKYIPELKRIMIRRNGTIKNIANVFYHSALKELKRLLPGDVRHRDLAASIQDYMEQLVVGIVKHWIAKTKHYDIALAGGLFANVKINQRIHEIPEVNSVFVHPGMSDEGIAVGAALAMYYKESGSSYDPDFETMRHVYLGPEYTQKEIMHALQQHDVQYEHFENVEAEIAKILANGGLVARFNGKMEYGPRALGNRTLLYQATDPSVKYWLNDALSRTEFMPYAPVVMTKHAEKCFEGISGAENTARFMTITFQCTGWMAKNCPGVVHIDNTARPQFVSESDNPSMYRVLAEYYKLTGSPVLINTSFNMHEEPIVCSPDDAIRSFKQGRLDYLAIGTCIAKHPNPFDRNVSKEKYERLVNRKGPVQMK